MDFLGIKLSDKVPDENTIWMFKEKLKEHNLSQVLFDLFTDKLGEQGVIAKTGSMVDASFVDVPKQRNSKDDNNTIKAGSVPIEFGKNKHKKAKIRVRVEPIFGFMTNSMHDALDMRQIGKERIKSCIGLLNLTYNLFRYEQIIRLKIS